MWFETKLGVRYEMPDLLEEQVSEAHKSLDHSHEESLIVLTNISRVMLGIPRRIIKRAGVGDRCFWESND